MKHKHYDAIVAFAEGKAVQIRYHGRGNWDDWRIKEMPPFDGDDEYRVKPEPISAIEARSALVLIESVTSYHATGFTADKFALVHSFINQQEQQ
jgi:hypothetical protein